MLECQFPSEGMMKPASSKYKFVIFPPVMLGVEHVAPRGQAMHVVFPGERLYVPALQFAHTAESRYSFKWQGRTETSNWRVEG